MKDIITGFCLLLTVPSVIQFWIWFIKLEKTKQIDLSDKK